MKNRLMFVDFTRKYLKDAGIPGEKNPNFPQIFGEHLIPFSPFHL